MKGAVRTPASFDEVCVCTVAEALGRIVGIVVNQRKKLQAEIT